MAQLNKLDTAVFEEVPALQAEVKSLQTLAGGIQKTATTVTGPLPVPNINDISRKLLRKQKQKYLGVAKKESLLFASKVFSEFVADNPPPIDEIVNKLNPIIDNINMVLRGVGGAVKCLKQVSQGVMTVMAVLLVVYIATKIVSMIPAPGAGVGVTISFTSFISVAQEINRVVGVILEKLATIAFAVLSVAAQLLNILMFLAMIVGLINAFLSTMMALMNSLIVDSLKTADEWANTVDMKDDGSNKINKENMVGDGGGIGTGVSLGIDGNNKDVRKSIMNQINKLQFDMANNLIKCKLPDGSIENLTPDECSARGGSMVNSSLDLSNLQDLLGKLGGAFTEDGEMDNRIITSLLNLNDDVTIEKATKEKGKRYGFYQSDIAGVTTNLNFAPIDIADVDITTNSNAAPMEYQVTPNTPEEYLSNYLNSDQLVDVTDELKVYALSKAYEYVSGEWTSYTSMGESGVLQAGDILVPIDSASGLLSGEYKHEIYSIKNIGAGKYSSNEIKWWAEPPKINDELVEIKNFKIYRRV